MPNPREIRPQEAYLENVTFSLSPNSEQTISLTLQHRSEHNSIETYKIFTSIPKLIELRDRINKALSVELMILAEMTSGLPNRALPSIEAYDRAANAVKSEIRNPKS